MLPHWTASTPFRTFLLTRLAAIPLALCLLPLTGCMPVIKCVLHESNGLVLDADTAKPIPAATITIQYSNTGKSGTARTTSNAQGHFRIPPRYAFLIMIAPNDSNLGDHWYATISAPGYVPATAGGPRLPPASPPASTVSFDPTLGTVVRLKPTTSPAPPPSPPP